MRFAIYFTPPPDHQLTMAACTWLGRDAFSGQEWSGVPSPEVPRRSARRYGFHATMKAPFRLADGWTPSDLQAALDGFCDRHVRFVLPPLRLARMGGFLALATGPSSELSLLEHDAVHQFEPYRAPLTADEVARRSPNELSQRQRANLDSYGYPHVLDEFTFHMTLTDRIAEPDQDAARRSLMDHFGSILDAPLELGWLALFVENEPGASFEVAQLSRLADENASGVTTT